MTRRRPGTAFENGPACAPFRAHLDAIGGTGPRSWAEVEAGFLRAMEQFDAEVIAGRASEGERQNGKGDYFNEVIAAIVENASRVTLSRRRGVNGLVFRDYNLDVTHPATGERTLRPEYDAAVLDDPEAIARSRFATLPTPLESGPDLPGGVRLWVKRDDLTGLGVGGNKVRKLEYLCGEAIVAGARSLVTVGAAQSNHCRMTAAAGAVLGLDVHLVLSGDRPDVVTGNQLLSVLFGAQLHFTGAHHSHWGELEIAREGLTEQLAADGAAPYSIPVGGSTAVGTLGYLAAFDELMAQCSALDVRPTAIVHASSSGGTHAGLVAGRARHRSRRDAEVPEVLAIGVAKGVVAGVPDVAALARAALELTSEPDVEVGEDDVVLDARWLGEDYGIPTLDGDAAIRWAARRGGWVLDRTYTGKGFAGLLANAAEGRWPPGSEVVFVHTGGLPAVFAPGGAPDVEGPVPFTS